MIIVNIYSLWFWMVFLLNVLLYVFGIRCNMVRSKGICDVLFVRKKFKVFKCVMIYVLVLYLFLN